MIRNSTYKERQQQKAVRFVLLLLFLMVHCELFCQTDNEFWFAAPEVSYQFSAASGINSINRDRSIQLVLTCFDQQANVRICQPANLLFPIIYQIVPTDTFIVVDLTPFIDIIENKPADSVLPYGLLVSSDKPITVNYEITHYSVPDGNGAMYVLKGKNALGYDFIIPSQTLYPNFPFCDPPARNCFDIVAVEDNTLITILPSSNMIGHNAGMSFNIILNRGESWEGRALSGSILDHLNSTTITSDKPIAVTVSDDNIFVDNQPQLTDLAGDQLIPANIAGTEYADVETYMSHTVSICAYYYGTDIYHNGVFAFSLNRGQCFNFQVNTGAHYFNSNKPVLIYSNVIHDPFDQAGGTVLPPLTCNGSKKVILPTPIVSPGNQGEAHEFIIITKPNNTITTTVNGSSYTIPSNFYFPVPGTGGAWVYAGMTTGTTGYPQCFYGTKRFLLEIGNVGPGNSSYYKLGCISNFSLFDLGPDRLICEGDSIKLDAGYDHDSIHWSNGDTAQTITINAAGNYYATVFDDGCTLSDTIIIRNFTIFNPLNLGSDIVLCSDSTLLNSEAGRFSYLWNTGDTTQRIWINSPGSYHVAVISNPEMCLLRDTIEVIASGVQTINIGNDTTICKNDSIHLDAGSGMASYLWNTGATTQLIWVNNSGTYKVTVTSGLCIYSDSLTVLVNPLPTVNLGKDVTVCFGQSYTFDAGFCSGCTYSWDNLTIGQTNIGTGQTFTTGQPGTYVANVTGNNGCIGHDTIILLIKSGLPVNISILSSMNSICAGIPVTFTATPENGGNMPTYQWKVNGSVAGTNSSVFTYNPATSDIVTCMLTSSITVCVSNNPATSNSITMVVNPLQPVSVVVSSTANPVCAGTSVTFNAVPTNGGSIPGYQWKVNGLNAGVNSPTYTYSPVNGDSVRCVMTSNLNCVTGNPASSAKIIMLGTLAPTVIFTSCFDTLTTVNAKPFKLKGGIPLGGSYSGPGVNSVTGTFTPSLAGTGLKSIVYTYTNVALCSANKTKTINVQSTAPFTCGNNLTDIRDAKTYPTVQIGTQCWMAANLNYGNQISPSQVQFDNCIAEKYCYNDNPLNCTNNGGLYQWDEMMKYDDTPAEQGLCPPGWHVPTETDWTTLFNFYLGNAFAGKPLQDTNITGFKALTSGVFHLNSSWSFNGFATLFWSSTSWNATKGISHGLNVFDNSVSMYPSSRANAFPVRCTQD